MVLHHSNGRTELRYILKSGNLLTMSFNENEELLVVDLIHKDEEHGNEITCIRFTQGVQDDLLGPPEGYEGSWPPPPLEAAPRLDHSSPR